MYSTQDETQGHEGTPGDRSQLTPYSVEGPGQNPTLNALFLPPLQDQRVAITLYRARLEGQGQSLAYCPGHMA